MPNVDFMTLKEEMDDNEEKMRMKRVNKMIEKN
jgi:hypothetical protein